jgi:CubicO group peptidase (beta-lactamase class C family)
MSKVFTAVLVMNLVEEGKVRLDVPIREVLPEYRGPGKDSVTIHHLLTYSSGIEPALDALGMAPYQSPKSLDAFIEAYGSGPLVHTPGSRSVYGNTEYILLHQLIETVTQRTYEAVLEEVIVRPAGLTDTQLITADAPHAGWVPSYLYNDSLAVFTADTPYLPHLYFGAGALYSTAEDLLAFDQALFTHRLLSRASTEQLLTLHPDLGYTAYGLWGSTGWGTFSEPFYYRTGGIQGSTANWIHTMETGKTILVLSNTNATNLFELSEQLYLVGR